MKFLPLLSHLLLQTLVQATTTTSKCSLSDPAACLETLFNLSSSAADAVLGDDGTVIFQNGLLGNETDGCPTMSVIFARGTLEPGNVGLLTGPPFFAALASYLNTSTSSTTNAKNLAIQGVDYPADIPGFLAGGSALGAFAMASLINHTLSRCPSTVLTVSGYSQGAQVVHLATASLPANTTSRISSVILFGDPKNGTAIQSVDAKRVLTICHAGDDICEGGDFITGAHLNYSGNAGEAAMFALGGMAGLGITSARMADLRGAGDGLG